ncbi:hypothetical protein [Mycolicibacterium bacteremicum]|uniref:ESX-1 secretion-associated protein n=1 Tax=Mycolicibacterium bacteremicum TaxID=564198 RepID=A0A1W9Z479_MYCBA|nr:hypothetical protein [Mycolicibacterium bacteremicum]MCV7431702.1 ESX-1 secretion-associated protein [Mycolicibacterium bacteremicum]ORA06820.1 hypothetical protein BST17_04090 [Mycolicibacterium bacteremicum]
MGYIDAARMDVAALLTAAHRYDTAAGLVEDTVGRCLLVFGPAGAGREYTDCGAEVQRSVAATVGRLRSWAAANREVAASLRASAADYADIDTRVARRIG